MMCHCYYVLWLLEMATPVDTYPLPSVLMGKKINNGNLSGPC